MITPWSQFRGDRVNCAVKRGSLFPRFHLGVSREVCERAQDNSRGLQLIAIRSRARSSPAETSGLRNQNCGMILSRMEAAGFLRRSERPLSGYDRCISGSLLLIALVCYDYASDTSFLSSSARSKRSLSSLLAPANSGCCIYILKRISA